MERYGDGDWLEVEDVSTSIMVLCLSAGCRVNILHT